MAEMHPAIVDRCRRLYEMHEHEHLYRGAQSLLGHIHCQIVGEGWVSELRIAGEDSPVVGLKIDVPPLKIRLPTSNRLIETEAVSIRLPNEYFGRHISTASQEVALAIEKMMSE